MSATARVLLLLACGWVAACASGGKSGDGDLPKHVQVRDFAVTEHEVELDRGLGPTAMRAVSGEVASREVGHAAADTLARTLVERLGAYGIKAERAKRGAKADAKTLVIVGRFITLEAGSETRRTLVGFGAGSGEVRTEARAFKGGALVAQAETVARNSEPSAAKTAGGAPAAGATELALSSARSDARRAAEEIAKRIRDAYKRHGWL
jgi:Domain of unknown function (DUF4410)